MAVTLDLDGSVEKISAKLRQTREDLVGVSDGYKKVGEASQAAIGVAATEQDKFNKATGKSGKEMGKQIGIIEKLENHLKRLKKGQREATNVKNIKKYNREIADTRAALGAMSKAGVSGFLGMNAAATGSLAIFKALGTTLATTFAPLFAVGAAVQGIRRIVGLVSEYEQTAADLSAITGANGDTLEFLKQSAVEVGTETTVSAAQTLEAYKLIASAKPELLSNAEGLASITKEAVALTEAMGGELPTAATNLTDIMNQFQAPAEEASRYVNALAAGSKEGSAEVAQLAQSFLVAGTSMKSSNVQLEEGVGLIEALAERGVKGAEAGTALRNVITKLSATDVLPKGAIARLNAAGVNMEALSDKSLSFSDRLRALAPIQNDANALVSVFGLENLNAARNLIEQTDRIDELAAAVTGTNTAYEQAATRTRTLEGETARFRNTLQALIQGNSGNLSQFLAFFVRLAREGLLGLQAGIDAVTPSLRAIGDAFSNVYRALLPIFPLFQSTSEETSTLGRVMRIALVPIRILFNLIAFGINLFAGTVEWIGRLVGQGPALGGVFDSVGSSVESFFSFLENLPVYVAAGLESIKVFIVETAKGIGTLGSNISSVLKEAFSIKKLLTSGTGDLLSAVDDLLVNPFDGVGDKAGEAFAKTFADRTKKELKKIKPESVVAAATATDNTIAPNDPAFSATDARAEKEAAKAAKAAEKQAQEVARLRLQAMKDGADKELALEQARFDDLFAKLEKYGIDTEDAVQQHEINKFAIRQKFIEDAANLEGLSGQERVEYLYNQTKAEIDALESALRSANGGSLLDEQVQQLNLLRKNASEEYMKAVEAFYSEEQKNAQEHEINLLELKRDGFESQAKFEEFKEKEILDIKLKYAEAQLALLEKTKGAEDDAALALRRTINQLKGDIDELSKTTSAKGFNLFSLFGLDSEDAGDKKIIEGIGTAATTTLDLLGQINAARLESAEKALEASTTRIEAIDSEIDAKKSQLENEKSLDDEGFSNNSQRIEQEIAQLQDQKRREQVEQNKALAEKKKIQKQQAIVDTITQSSSLLSAAAQIFASVSAIPFVGPILGASLVAAMLGSFIAAKAKVFQNINKQKAEKGMFGRVKGKRHYEGGERFGDHIEVEDGEAFGVLSRSATKKFSGAYEAFTNAANKGDRLGMAKVASMLGAGVKIDRNIADAFLKKESKLGAMKTEFNATFASEELKENNSLLKQLIATSKSKRSVEYVGNKKIIKTGNNTRIVNK